ncbi:tautomerase family protein [Gordonia crocea]|uniref:Tautomerase n=1 Tax=Gordonia crocea TaxID=589162 RepID=A0A7I9UYD5_9ACTN|nr:tautomerase family protein [Gordonia crocea]GED98207.1 tautomerase [Gordonia crocea]
MPSTTIDVRKRWSDDDVVAIIDAVHAALVAAFHIPENDKHVRLVEHLPHRLAYPPSLAQPDLMTLVTIDCFAGRSVDAKRILYREIVRRLSACGIPADHITITVRDVPMENWGIRGGQAGCDVNVGFDVNV